MLESERRVKEETMLQRFMLLPTASSAGSRSPTRGACSVFFLLCHRPRRRTLGYLLTRRERGDGQVQKLEAVGGHAGKSPLLGQTLKELLSLSPPMEDGGSGVEERLGRSWAAKGEVGARMKRAFRRRAWRGKNWRPSLGGIPE